MTCCCCISFCWEIRRSRGCWNFSCWNCCRRLCVRCGIGICLGWSVWVRLSWEVGSSCRVRVCLSWEIWGRRRCWWRVSCLVSACCRVAWSHGLVINPSCCGIQCRRVAMIDRDIVWEASCVCACLSDGSWLNVRSCCCFRDVNVWGRDWSRGGWNLLSCQQTDIRIELNQSNESNDWRGKSFWSLGLESFKLTERLERLKGFKILFYNRSKQMKDRECAVRLLSRASNHMTTLLFHGFLDTIHSLLGLWQRCESQIQPEATGKIDMIWFSCPMHLETWKCWVMKISLTVVDAVVVYESVSVVE